MVVQAEDAAVLSDNPGLVREGEVWRRARAGEAGERVVLGPPVWRPRADAADEEKQRGVRRGRSHHRRD
mgnify:CR=1 FL=1